MLPLSEPHVFVSLCLIFVQENDRFVSILMHGLNLFMLCAIYCLPALCCVPGTGDHMTSEVPLINQGELAIMKYSRSECKIQNSKSCPEEKTLHSSRQRSQMEVEV